MSSIFRAAYDWAVLTSIGTPKKSPQERKIQNELYIIIFILKYKWMHLTQRQKMIKIN